MRPGIAESRVMVSSTQSEHQGQVWRTVAINRKHPPKKNTDNQLFKHKRNASKERNNSKTHDCASIYEMIFTLLISQNMARERRQNIFFLKKIYRKNTYKRQKRVIFV